MNAADVWRENRLPLAILVTASALGVAIGIRSTASASLNAVGPCPKLSEAANLPHRPSGGLLRGDLDGDGVRDSVSIRYAATARASCGFLLVLETRSKTFAARVPEGYKPPQELPVRQWPFAEPYVALIVRLSHYRSQIVVARWHGAAVANVSLHGIVDGRLKQLHFSPKLYADQLSLFGTVGTGDTNARCRWGGPLIILSRGPTSATGERWGFHRTEYRLAGGRFMTIRTRSAVVPQAATTNVSRRWGFEVRPFTGCAVARGRRL